MIQKKYLRTRTAKYFLNLYNRASLREAIEVAAYKVRGTLTLDPYDYFPLPVDLDSIATGRKIQRSNKNLADSSRDAFLVAKKGRFLLKTNPGGSIQRDRFSIAHEIGHSLFYKEGDHQIGVTSEIEARTEEFICNLFAGALLMPPKNIMHFIQKIEDSTAWSVLHSFEKAADAFKASLPAFVHRIGVVQSKPKFDFIAVCLTYFENEYTKTDPRLRIRTCSSLGKLRNTRTWYNRSAKGVNMIKAEILFEKWGASLKGGRERTGGKYTLNTDGDVIRADEKTLNWFKDDLEFAVLIQNKWIKEILPFFALNCLYVKRGWTENEAYIISILKKRT